MAKRTVLTLLYSTKKLMFTRKCCQRRDHKDTVSSSRTLHPPIKRHVESRKIDFTTGTARLNRITNWPVIYAQMDFLAIPCRLSTKEDPPLNDLCKRNLKVEKALLKIKKVY